MRHPRYFLAYQQYFLQYHRQYSPTQYSTHASTSTALLTLAHQHVTLVAMSLTLPCQPRNPGQHATHTSTLPTQARHPRHPRKYATHATHGSTIARHFSKSFLICLIFKRFERLTHTLFQLLVTLRKYFSWNFLSQSSGNVITFRSVFFFFRLTGELG